MGTSGSFKKNLQLLIEEKKAAIANLSFFDASVWTGTPSGFPLSPGKNLEELVVDLETFSIHRFLLSCWEGLSVSPQEGNRRLSLLEKNLPTGCSAIWTALPLLPENPGPVPGLGTPTSRTAGIRIFPKSHNYPLTSWTTGSLAEWCVQYGKPVFMMHTEIDWKDLYAFASDFPKLTIIVESQTEKTGYQFRTICGLMKERPNIFLESSNVTGSGYIEYMVREFGSPRLVFGSFYPVNDPLAAIGMILDAEISEDERKDIAGGNLTVLLSKNRVDSSD